MISFIMKRIIALLLIITIMAAFCACTQTSAQEVTPSATQEPTPIPEPTATPQPETKPGTVKDIELLIPYKILSRGDKLSVTGENEDYYLVELDGRDCFVEKKLVRLSSEETPDKKTVYFHSGAKVFDNYNLTGDAIDTPQLNTEAELIDEFNGIAIVKYDGFEGYVLSSSLSDTEISTWTDNSWSGGGGDSGGGAAPAPAPAPVIDGGDIALGYEIITGIDTVLIPAFAVFPTFDTLTETGTVFTDGTIAYIAILGYGEKVKVISKDEDTASILYDDIILEVPSDAIRADGEDVYEEWEGYAKSGCKLLSDKHLSVEEKTLNQNDIVKVVEEYNDYYIVEFEDAFYCVALDKVSVDEIPAWTNDYSWPDGGGGGGDFVPSGGGEWTEPVL